MKASFITYGCKSNRYETELIRQGLLDAGVTEGNDAELYVINTCTVTSKIDSEIIRKVKQLKRRKNVRVAVTGCLVERNGGIDPVLAAHADIIIPNSRKFELSLYGVFGAKKETPLLRQFSGRDKAYIKAEDGCDNFCAYCEVPLVRGGKIKSRSSHEIAAEAAALSAAGFQEIVLTGINLGKYGSGKNDSQALLNLVRDLVGVMRGGRLRLSSIGPRETTKELVDFIAASEGRVCPHFHMSLQSGDDGVLKAMNRNYTSGQYADIMDYILKKMPEAAVTTDIIAGFPGETEKQHSCTCYFIKNRAFSRLHVFPYSDRPGTKASAMPEKVPEAVKKQRVKELLELGTAKEKEFAIKNAGKTLYVLAETGEKDGHMTGYTENYIKVYFKAAQDAAGKLLPVVIERVEEGKAWGRVE